MPKGVRLANAAPAVSVTWTQEDIQKVVDGRNKEPKTPYDVIGKDLESDRTNQAMRLKFLYENRKAEKRKREEEGLEPESEPKRPRKSPSKPKAQSTPTKLSPPRTVLPAKSKYRPEAYDAAVGLMNLQNGVGAFNMGSNPNGATITPPNSNADSPRRLSPAATPPHQSASSSSRTSFGPSSSMAYQPLPAQVANYFRQSIHYTATQQVMMPQQGIQQPATHQTAMSKSAGKQPARNHPAMQQQSMHIWAIQHPAPVANVGYAPSAFAGPSTQPHMPIVNTMNHPVSCICHNCHPR